MHLAVQPSLLPDPSPARKCFFSFIYIFSFCDNLVFLNARGSRILWFENNFSF